VVALGFSGAVVVGSTARASCEQPVYPSQTLKLANWKVTLPVDDPDQSGTQPLEITQPKLAGYRLDPWFIGTTTCDGVRFRNAVNGAHTTNSSYSRSELREMTDGGAANASWSSTSGTHTMVIDEAITHLPNTKAHVVAGQIHDADDDVIVFRLEGTKLYLTKGDDTHAKLITDSYTLGTRFQAKFVVGDGRVEAYYNGALQTTLFKNFSDAYFKAGVYTQANCDNSTPCDDTNYGEVVIYGLSVSHGSASASASPANPTVAPTSPPASVSTSATPTRTPTRTPTVSPTATSGGSNPTTSPVVIPTEGVLPVCAVTASADDGNVPANTIDNNLNNRWSAEGDGVWIRYDLCASVRIDDVLIAWHDGHVRVATFEVQTSSDGVSWSTKFNGKSCGCTESEESVELPDHNARYLRIVGYGNTLNDWTSISEVDVETP
jgi:hypothetical protein